MGIFFYFCNLKIKDSVITDNTINKTEGQRRKESEQAQTSL